MDKKLESLIQLKNFSNEIENLKNKAIKETNEIEDINILKNKALNEIIDYLLEICNLLENECFTVRIDLKNNKNDRTIMFNYKYGNESEDILRFDESFGCISNLKEIRNIFSKTKISSYNTLFNYLILNWKDIKPLIEKDIEKHFKDKINNSQKNFIKYKTEYEIVSNFKI